MMWVAIVVGAVACYMAKLAGLSVPERVLNNVRVQRVAMLLPIALLSALAATQTFVSDGSLTLDVRAVAVGAAVVAVLLRAPFLLVVALAALVAAGLRWVI